MILFRPVPFNGIGSIPLKVIHILTSNMRHTRQLGDGSPPSDVIDSQSKGLRQGGGIVGRRNVGRDLVEKEFHSRLRRRCAPRDCPLKVFSSPPTHGSSFRTSIIGGRLSNSSSAIASAGHPLLLHYPFEDHGFDDHENVNRMANSEKQKSLCLAIFQRTEALPSICIYCLKVWYTA